MAIDVTGLGIIMYSPSSAAHIAEGQDYLTEHYWDDDDVQEHIQAGTIVGFGTSSPGTFVLRCHAGYPDDGRLAAAGFKLRLGIRCDGIVVFRDLYDLTDWIGQYPSDQAISLPAGIHHVTLASDLPASGVLGDHQIIDVYFQPLREFPALARQGVPTLCS